MLKKIRKILAALHCFIFGHRLITIERFYSAKLMYCIHCKNHYVLKPSGSIHKVNPDDWLSGK